MRRLLRDLGTALVLLLVLGGLGVFAWASHHPHHQLVRRAEGWPIVGGWVGKFRQQYAGVGVDDDEATAGVEGFRPPRRIGPDVEIIYEVQPVPGGVFGPAGVPSPAAQGPTVWLAPGQPLLAAPAADAEVVGRVNGYVLGHELERDGPWLRVDSVAGRGWVRPRAGDGPPLGSDATPTLPLPGRAPEAAHLAAAEKLLGVSAPAGHLGPYALYTDVPRPERLVHLERIASQIEQIYQQRYGLAPAGEPQEALALFAREASYRQFQEREANLGGLPASGHALGGMAALYVEGRRRDEVAATLVHELTHLLNRRALGPALPPWLDEGIADDLASSHIGPAGDLDPRRLGGTIAHTGQRIDYFGGFAALRRLDQALRTDTAPPLARLVDLEWEAFVRSDSRNLNYAESALLVRYLLSGDSSRRADAFRRFLADVASGGPATGDALRAELGESWEDLQHGLAAWVAGEVDATAPLAAPPAAHQR